MLLAEALDGWMAGLMEIFFFYLVYLVYLVCLFGVCA
jgi:hypothetical protein